MRRGEHLRARTADGKTSKLAVSGGFFEVSNNRATVLGDSVTGAVGAVQD